MDKVFGRRRRKGQKRQATQRQPADPPARQGEFLFGFSLATNFLVLAASPDRVHGRGKGVKWASSKDWR